MGAQLQGLLGPGLAALLPFHRLERKISPYCCTPNLRGPLRCKLVIGENVFRLQSH